MTHITMVFIMSKVDIKNDLKNVQNVVKDIISLLIHFLSIWRGFYSFSQKKLQPFINIIIALVASKGVQMVFPYVNFLSL